MLRRATEIRKPGPLTLVKYKGCISSLYLSRRLVTLTSGGLETHLFPQDIPIRPSTYDVIL